MSVGFLALIAAGAAAAYVVSRNQAQTGWVTHTYEVERGIFEYRLLFERIETARRGYMLTQQPSFLQSYEEASVGVPRALARVRRLTADNPAQKRPVARLEQLDRAQKELADESVALVRSGRAMDALRRFGVDGSIAIVREMRRVTDRMFAEENRLLALREAEQVRTGRLFYWVIGVAALLLLGVAALSLVVIRRYVTELGRSQGALRQLNEGLEDAVKTRTADLQRANEEIQRFAYIVSHDLRSPLVNVMGFTAELKAATKPLAALIDRAEEEAPHIVDEEARLAAREDLPEAIGFIRASTQKMDRLINAILKLSREGRRVITPERLDMAALIEGIRGSLAHRLDAAGAEVRVDMPLPAIVSDRVAIEQVFSNLIENAVKYAAPGRPGVVEVRGRREGPRLIYEVADNGRGIDPKDHERVFDLFRRSGVQDQPGEGIGLAHVRALVYRLGGTIGVESQLGSGATFRVVLPAILVKEGERQS
nr:sensor histidine kinase [Sphingomonas jatrophae]